MRIVLLTPSVVLFDRTLHYFQAEFAATANWMRSRLPEAEVLVEASCLGTARERLLLRHLVHEPDFVLLWARIWEAPAARRIAELARQICPDVTIFVWGDAPQLLPQYFRRAPFDGYVHSGDPERGLADALSALARGGRPGHGLSFRDGERWLDTPKGRLLEPERWPLPDLSDLNPHAYLAVRKETADLSFTVSRGCPLPCAAWCPTPRREGVTDRRRPVDATLEFMARGPGPYELFQCHSPLFGRNRKWRTRPDPTGRAVHPSVPEGSGTAGAPHRLDALDLSRWDRKSYYDARCGLSPGEFYRLITDPAGFAPDGEGSRSCAA